MVVKLQKVNHLFGNTCASSVPFRMVSRVSAVQIKGDRLHAGVMFEFLCLWDNTCTKPDKAEGLSRLWAFSWRLSLINTSALFCRARNNVVFYALSLRFWERASSGSLHNQTGDISLWKRIKINHSSWLRAWGWVSNWWPQMIVCTCSCGWNKIMWDWGKVANARSSEPNNVVRGCSEVRQMLSMLAWQIWGEHNANYVMLLCTVKYWP